MTAASGRIAWFTTEVAMAKAKRERRTSIRTMPVDDSLSALDAIEAAERRVAAGEADGTPGADDANGRPADEEQAEGAAPA